MLICSSTPCSIRCGAVHSSILKIHSIRTVQPDAAAAYAILLAAAAAAAAAAAQHLLTSLQDWQQ